MRQNRTNAHVVVVLSYQWTNALTIIVSSLRCLTLEPEPVSDGIPTVTDPTYPNNISFSSLHSVAKEKMTEGHPTTPKGTAEEHIMLPECPPAPRASYKALDWNISYPMLSLAPSLDDNHNSSGSISSSPPSLKRGYDGVMTTPELLLKPRPSAPVGTALFASRSMDVSSFHQIRLIRRNKKSKMTKSPSFSRAAWISWPNQEGPRMKYHVVQIRIVLAAY